MVGVKKEITVWKKGRRGKNRREDTYNDVGLLPCPSAQRIEAFDSLPAVPWFHGKEGEGEGLIARDC